MVDVGTLRHRIVLADPSTMQTKGTLGGQTIAYTSMPSTVFASIAPVGGNQYMRDAVVQSDVTHLIDIRYRATTTPDTRVTFGSRKFDILEVVNIDERKTWMRLRCREVL